METTVTNDAKTLSLDAGTLRLSVENIAGDIEISGWDQQQIEISSPATNENYGIEDLFDIQQDGSDVRIRWINPGAELRRRGRYNGNWNIGGMIHAAISVGMGLNADLKIKVPYSSDIAVRTASGDIAISDVDGKVSIETASGDVDLHSVAGSVMAKTASGDIDVVDFAGRLGARTMSGDLEVQAGQLDAISVGTASGDVRLSGRLNAAGQYELQTVSGDVKVALPGDASLTAELHTISGDMSCRLPHENARHSRRDRRLAINGGDGPTLRVNTVSGDLVIAEWSGQPEGKSSRGAATERLGQLPAEVKARVSGDDDQGGQTVRLDEQNKQQATTELSVLEALERGEINVEEAIQRLSGK